MLWFSQGTLPGYAETILPMVEAAIVVSLGDAYHAGELGRRPQQRPSGYLVGPRLVAIRNQPTGTCWTVGATLRPGAVPALFGVPSRAVRDVVLDLDLVWGQGLGSLREQLAAQADADAALSVWERALLARCGPDADLRTRRARLALHMLTAEPRAASVGGVSDRVGVTRQHLARELHRVAGLSPGEVRRLARFEQLVGSIDTRRPVNWAELATRAGYADQPHMVRDFKSLAGLAPSAYVTRRSTVFGPLAAGTDAAFVPEVPSVQDG
jgi:AraC-like DNA-binding protein